MTKINHGRSSDLLRIVQPSHYKTVVVLHILFVEKIQQELTAAGTVPDLHGDSLIRNQGKCRLKFHDRKILNKPVAKMAAHFFLLLTGLGYFCKLS